MVSQSQNNEALTLGNAGRSLAFWEILSVITSCLIAEWAIHTFAYKGGWIGAIPIVLGLSLMLFSQREHGETARDLGFRFDNFLAACRLLILPTLIAIALIAFGSWLTSGANFSLRPTRPRLFFVPAWALFQQYALQGFINRRAQIVFGSGPRSVLAVALAFSLLHLPGPLLGLLALAGGFVWASVYQRRPNLYALALSHSLVSLALALAIPPNLTHNLRIGYKYFGIDL